MEQLINIAIILVIKALFCRIVVLVLTLKTESRRVENG